MLGAPMALIYVHSIQAKQILHIIHVFQDFVKQTFIFKELRNTGLCKSMAPKPVYCIVENKFTGD